MGYSPWGRKGSDTAEQLTLSLSNSELGRSPGDENGYSLQYFGLENSSPWGHKESDMTE